MREALERLAEAGLSGEVIVCDNGSSDGSGQLAAAAGAATVIREERPGYGRALMSGIAAASGRFILMVDADGSYDLRSIGPMIAALEQGADLVMGNRFRGRIAAGAMPWMFLIPSLVFGRGGLMALVAGLLVFGGLGLLAIVGGSWVVDRGALVDPIPPILLAGTLVTVGVQGAFNAFFLSLLSVEIDLGPGTG